MTGGEMAMAVVHALITGLLLWLVKELKDLAVIVARIQQKMDNKK